MPKRRPLTDGLKSTPKADPGKEAEFVHQPKKAKEATPKQPAEPSETTPVPESRPAATPAQARGGRVPFTTRLRADIGAALMRASLERKLAGLEPNAVQDILDSALEPWLKDNGYLK